MRSLLFVPGDSVRKLEKGLGAGADVLLVDLEDSVALSGKDAARRTAAAFLAASAARGRTGRASTSGSTASTPGSPTPISTRSCRPRPTASCCRRPSAVRTCRISAPSSRCARPNTALPTAPPAIIAIATESAARRVRARHASPARATVSRGSPGAARISSADLGAEANRGPDGLYTDPYRLARALTLFARSGSRGRRDRHRLHQFPRPRRACAPSAARRAATALPPRWRSTRPRFRSSTRPSRPPPEALAHAHARSSTRSRRTRTPASSASTARCSTARICARPSGCSRGPRRRDASGRANLSRMGEVEFAARVADRVRERPFRRSLRAFCPAAGALTPAPLPFRERGSPRYWP